MIAEPVSAEELEVSKSSFIEPFPRNFESAAQTAGLYAQDELLGRSHDYWKTYRDNIRAVDAAAIRQAFVDNLRPADMVVLVVGNLDEIMAGHPDHADRMTDFGEIVKVPLRDPMTLEPLE
jgi:predicted Zn-dependent peptidase